MTDTTKRAELLADREAFIDAHHKHLDLTEINDAWGRPMFRHSHVEAMWDGWKKGRAALRSLAAQDQKPAAWRWRGVHSNGPYSYSETRPDDHPDYPTEPLYLSPPPAAVEINASAEARLRGAHIEVLRGLVDVCAHPVNDTGPNKTKGPHLINMIDAIERNPSMPIDKIARWTGFIQGVLCARGVIDVDTERDRTRPIFSAYPNASDCAKSDGAIYAEVSRRETPPEEQAALDAAVDEALSHASDCDKQGSMGDISPGDPKDLSDLLSTPSVLEPSDRTDDVTLDELDKFLRRNGYFYLGDDEDECLARTILDAFTVGRR